jgi:hypothetical protein
MVGRKVGDVDVVNNAEVAVERAVVADGMALVGNVAAAAKRIV